MSEEFVSEGTASRWATGGAIFAAILASACCILPLVLGALGLSAVALAGAFESVRPYLLVLTAGLLAAGFYYNSFGKEECAPGEACEVQRPGLRRFNRSMLWLGMVAVVALAFFPSYAGLFAGEEIPAKATLGAVPSETVVLAVSGMTCEACSVSIQRELAQVPGVLRAAVSFSTSEAVVEVDTRARPESKALTAAVERAGAGYSASLKKAADQG